MSWKLIASESNINKNNAIILDAYYIFVWHADGKFSVVCGNHDHFIYKYVTIGKKYYVEVDWKDPWNRPYTFTDEFIFDGDSYKKTIYSNSSEERQSCTTVNVKLYEEYTPTPPTTPSSITVPTSIKGGESLSISWGSSSGATRYHLERSVNGGSWTQIYQGSNRNYTDTITKGWNTVAYRVRAYNSDGYSSYRTSATRTVINFPEFNMKVDGALKTSENGWVKVDGILREIESIHIKIDGTLKEV